MKNFGESVSTIRTASLTAFALFCLLAVVVFTVPTGAQRAAVGDRSGSRGKALAERAESVALAPTANLTVYTYSPEVDTLFRFNSDTPDTVTPIPLTGIDTDDFEILEFIDFRHRTLPEARIVGRHNMIRTGQVSYEIAKHMR